jgi:hypothetical protein
MTDKHPKRPRGPIVRSAKPHLTFMLRMGSLDPRKWNCLSGEELV